MKREIGPRQAQAADNEATHIYLWAHQVREALDDATRQVYGEAEYDENVLEQLAAIERNAKALRERLERTTKRIAPEDPSEEETTCTRCGMLVLTRCGYGFREDTNKCPEVDSDIFPGHRVNAEVFRNWEARVVEFERYQARGQKVQG